MLAKLFLMFTLLAFAGLYAQTEDIMVGTTSRNMIVYAPSELPENAPLLISMHGMNQDAPFQQNAAKLEDVADTAKFLVVYPNGLNKRWDISGNTDIEFILTIIDSMYSRYNIDRNRVYLSGFSMGGMMTYFAATKIADKIAAFAPVSGYMLRSSDYSSARPVPIIHIHGDDDQVVDYPGLGPYLQGWRDRNNCPSAAQTIQPYPAGKTSSAATWDYWGPCAENTEVVLITLAGKGHWYSLDEASVNSSVEIWNFVKKFSLGNIITVPEHRDSVFNGSFAQGSLGWTLNVWDGSAAGSVESESYRIEVDGIGTNNHDIQLVQSGIVLEQGKSYEVQFDAYAASARTLEVNVEMEEDPWTSYLESLPTYNLSTSSQRFTLQFTMNEATDSSGRISFNAGASTGTVWLDNVSIKTYEPPTSIRALAQFSGVRISVYNRMLETKFSGLPGSSMSLQVFNLTGQQIKYVNWETGSPGSYTLDVSSLPAGTYYVSLSTEAKTIHSEKIQLK